MSRIAIQGTCVLRKLWSNPGRFWETMPGGQNQSIVQENNGYVRIFELSIAILSVEDPIRLEI